MQNQNLHYSINKSNLFQIIEHLNACDGGFVPALSTQVKLDQYSQKLVENATRFEAFSNDKLVGLIACYLNDYKNKIGFITNVSVMSSFYGIGIAKQLLTMLMKYAAEHNFNCINLEVNGLNLPALSLYKKAGFVLASEKIGNLQMTFRLSNDNNKLNIKYE